MTVTYPHTHIPFPPQVLYEKSERPFVETTPASAFMRRPAPSGFFDTDDDFDETSETLVDGAHAPSSAIPHAKERRAGVY